MTITSLSGIGGNSTAPQSITNASDNVQAALASIASGTQTGDVADVSIASQLQSQTAALTTVGGDLTQALSLTQVAGGGIEQIQGVLGELQSLALQAQSPTLNNNNRSQLNQQFQELSSEIDSIAGTTSFGGQNVLDGSLSGANALSLNSLLGQDTGSGDNTLSIASQSSESLFGGALDISSADDAGQALTAIGNALNTVAGTQSNIGAFQQTLNYASANVDSATNNLEAANASFSDTDLAAASTQSSLAQVQYNAAIAVEAQTNNLNPALLQLVG